MIIHLKPPEGTKIEVSEQGDVIMRLPKASGYESRNDLIGLVDVHTHEPGDLLGQNGANHTPPCDRVSVGVTRRGYIRISR